MKQLLMGGVTALLLTFSSLPAMADNSNSISFYSDSTTVTVGSQTVLRLSSIGTSSAQNLTIQTSLGTLQGNGSQVTVGSGSSITVSPNSDNSYPAISLTSTSPGIANVQVYQNGAPIASTSVTFVPGVQMSADNTSLTAGSFTSIHLKLTQLITPSPSLQIQASLGTLNGTGSSIQEDPMNFSNNTYPIITLSSTQSGISTISAYSNGNLVASATVNFHPGQLNNISVKASPAIMNSSTVTIAATDSYGNLVTDGTAGSVFNVSTDLGQLMPIVGTSTSSNGSNITISTKNGIAELMLSSNTSGTANLTVNSVNATQNAVTINGTPGNVITIPVNLTTGSNSQPGPNSSGNINAPITPFSDFQDVTGSSDRNSAIRELSFLGVLNGYTDHSFQPSSQIQRSEFAAILARYMGVASSESALIGSMYSPFADVPKDAWYSSAVAVDASLGFIKGDGINYYPDHSITYAEVAQILLRNLGIQSEANWPDGPVNIAKQNGLFTGIANFDENAPATRGDVAVMVRNALHVTQTNNSTGTGNTSQSLEMKTLGFTSSGDVNQPAVINSIGTNNLTGGANLQETLGNQSGTLNLASNVILVGGNTLTDLVNKKVHYLTNRQGLVTYIEIIG